MKNLNYIKEPIKKELTTFNNYFKNTLKSDSFLLTLITKYIVKTKGKQMRPMLVFLSSKLIGNEVKESSYIAATLIELMHTATLIHDDVVDEASYRRGFLTLHKIWGNNLTVLIGDYLLAKGLIEAVKTSEYSLLQIVSEAVKEMSEGELLQIEKAKRLNTTEEDYYKIIKQKTASLIASCTKSGTVAVTQKEEDVNNMYNFGLNLGIAFQIKDDLLDFDINSKAGKTYGNDIKERKMTLPLIYTLQKTNKKDKKSIMTILRKKNKTTQDINNVIYIVKQYDGITYAEEQMEIYKNKALSYLAPYKQHEIYPYLEAFTDFVTKRKK